MPNKTTGTASTTEATTNAQANSQGVTTGEGPAVPGKSKGKSVLGFLRNTAKKVANAPKAVREKIAPTDPEAQYKRLFRPDSSD